MSASAVSLRYFIKRSRFTGTSLKSLIGRVSSIPKGSQTVFVSEIVIISSSSFSKNSMRVPSSSLKDSRSR